MRTLKIVIILLINSLSFVTEAKGEFVPGKCLGQPKENPFSSDGTGGHFYHKILLKKNGLYEGHVVITQSLAKSCESNESMILCYRDHEKKRVGFFLVAINPSKSVINSLDLNGKRKKSLVKMGDGFRVSGLVRFDNKLVLNGLSQQLLETLPKFLKEPRYSLAKLHGKYFLFHGRDWVNTIGSKGDSCYFAGKKLFDLKPVKATLKGEEDSS